MEAIIEELSQKDNIVNDIDVVRKAIKENVSDIAGVITLDAEFMLGLCLTFDHEVFILPGNEVYTREEIMNIYPFDTMGIQPESIFVRQKIVKTDNECMLYYDNLPENLSTRDLVRDAAGLPPLPDDNGNRQIIITKIYVAGNNWQHFQFLYELSKFTRTETGLKIMGYSMPLKALEGTTQTAAICAAPEQK